MEFKSELHLFNYLKKIFVSKEIDIPNDEEWFKKACFNIYVLCQYLDGEKNSEKKLFFNNSITVFSWEIVCMIRNEENEQAFVEFITKFWKQSYFCYAQFVEQKEVNESEFDYEFIQKYLCHDMNFERMYTAQKSTDFIIDFNKYAFNTAGIYFLYNEKSELIYIGKSQNLFSRLESSAADKKAVMYSYALCENKAEMHLYEVYYILKRKPRMNKDCADDDELKIDLPELNFSVIKQIYGGDENGIEKND